MVWRGGDPRPVPLIPAVAGLSAVGTLLDEDEDAEEKRRRMEAKIAAAGKPVMLDFYADWCVSCKEMERFTFADPAVAKRLEAFQLIQADVTANNEADKALLKRFGLFGPPGIIFFDSAGQERQGLRVVGFQPAEAFGRVLDAALAQ